MACVFVVLNSILFPFEVLEVPLLVYLKGKLDLEGAAFADARNLIVLGPLVSGELVSLWIEVNIQPVHHFLETRRFWKLGARLMDVIVLKFASHLN